jgi:hypothetical protein
MSFEGRKGGAEIMKEKKREKHVQEIGRMGKEKGKVTING